MQTKTKFVLKPEDRTASQHDSTKKINQQ